jgi:hypothetical protein
MRYLFTLFAVLSSILSYGQMDTEFIKLHNNKNILDVLVSDEWKKMIIYEIDTLVFDNHSPIIYRTRTEINWSDSHRPIFKRSRDYIKGRFTYDFFIGYIEPNHNEKDKEYEKLFNGYFVRPDSIRD